MLKKVKTNQIKSFKHCFILGEDEKSNKVKFILDISMYLFNLLSESLFIKQFDILSKKFIFFEQYIIIHLNKYNGKSYH